MNKETFYFEIIVKQSECIPKEYGGDFAMDRIVEYLDLVLDKSDWDKSDWDKYINHHILINRYDNSFINEFIDFLNDEKIRDDVVLGFRNLWKEHR